MLKPLALRLNPGQDLKAELDNLGQFRNIEAACIVTCMGNLCGLIPLAPYVVRNTGLS